MPDETARGTLPDMSGPASGDKVRLADSGLFVAVEKDFTVPPAGGEPSGRPRQGPGESAADTIIRHALVVDYWGIVRADVGLKDGRIVGIGRAGIDIVVGPATAVIDAAGRILTAGAIDAFVPVIGPRQAAAALSSGVTTLLGGPPTGSAPATWQLSDLIATAGAVNLAFSANGRISPSRALAEQIAAGAAGIALDAGRPALPAVIDTCLAVADTHDVPLTIRTGSAGAAGLADTVAPLDRRVVHVCHDDGVGSPGMARLCSLPNVLPSSPVAHPDADAAPQILPAALPQILHDIGALSLIVSGSAGGGDIIAAAFRVAAAMKARRGRLPEDDAGSDNVRVRRYLAKVTINPAIAHGLDEWVGSIEIGKLADLVLWSPATFGVRPDMVIRLGAVVTGATSAPDAMRSAVTFVSQASLALGIADGLPGHTLLPVRNTRSISKESMVHNSALPAVEIDPATGAVRIDGELLAPAGYAPPDAPT
jgi:urease subunit alpha